MKLVVLITLIIIDKLVVQTNAQDESNGTTTQVTDPCYVHNTIDENWRLVNNTESSAHCDQNLSRGWYKMEINGQIAEIPHVCIKGPACGVISPVHIEFEETGEPFHQETRRAWACTAYPIFRKWQCCALKESILVKNCGTYYVYHLEPLSDCNAGYCIKRNIDGVEVFTAKTGEAATSLDVTPRECNICLSNGIEIPSEHSIQPRDIPSVRKDGNCPDGYLSCADNSSCYTSIKRCNDYFDCHDRSDEEKCPKRITCPEGTQICSYGCDQECSIQSSVVLSATSSSLSSTSTNTVSTITVEDSTSNSQSSTTSSYHDEILRPTTSLTPLNRPNLINLNKDSNSDPPTLLSFSFTIRGSDSVTSLKSNKESNSPRHHTNESTSNPSGYEYSESFISPSVANTERDSEFLQSIHFDSGSFLSFLGSTFRSDFTDSNIRPSYDLASSKFLSKVFPSSKENNGSNSDVTAVTRASTLDTASILQNIGVSIKMQSSFVPLSSELFDTPQFNDFHSSSCSPCSVRSLYSTSPKRLHSEVKSKLFIPTDMRPSKDTLMSEFPSTILEQSISQVVMSKDLSIFDKTSSYSLRPSYSSLYRPLESSVGLKVQELFSGTSPTLFEDKLVAYLSSSSGLEASFASEGSNLYSSTYAMKSSSRYSELELNTASTSQASEHILSSTQSIWWHYSVDNSLPSTLIPSESEYLSDQPVISQNRIVRSSSVLTVVLNEVTNDPVTKMTPPIKSFEEFIKENLDIFIIIVTSSVALLLGIFIIVLCIRRRLHARTWTCRQEEYYSKCEKDLLMKANSPRKSFSMENPINEEEMLEDENQMTDNMSLHLSLEGLNISSTTNASLRDNGDGYVIPIEDLETVDSNTRTEDTQF